MSNYSEVMMSSPKTKYRPEFVQMLKEHLESGNSFQSFGGVAKVGNYTLYSWVGKYPDFKAVKDLHPFVKPKIYALCSACKLQHLI